MSKKKDRYIETRGYGGYDDYPGPRQSYSGVPGIQNQDRQPMTNQGYRAYQDYGYHDQLNREASTHYGKGPKGYRRSDEKIYDEVCEFLTSHYEVDASEIEVQVKDGVVILDGEVDSRRTKRIAEDVVADINGVIDVRNRLEVSAHDRSPQQEIRSARHSTDSTLDHSK